MLALCCQAGDASSLGSLSKLPEELGLCPVVVSLVRLSPGLVTFDLQPKDSSDFLCLLSFGLSVPLSPVGLL